MKYLLSALPDITTLKAKDTIYLDDDTTDLDPILNHAKRIDCECYLYDSNVLYLHPMRVRYEH